MTKKDYVAVAAMLNELKSETLFTMASKPETVRVMVAHRLANIFANDNARFDRARFMLACDIDRWKQ